MTDANGVALLTVCGVGVATLTPIVFNNQSGGNVNTIQAIDLRDTGGTLTVGQTATLSPSAATNPTSSAVTASIQNGEAGEETYTLTLNGFTGNPHTVVFTVRNTSVDTLIYIVDCDGTDVVNTTTAADGTITIISTGTAIIGGGTATCTATIGAGDATATVTIDSALAGGASITATATSTTSPFTQATSNTATKTWVSTNAEDTAFATGQSRSGTVTSVDKGSTTDCAGSYILTVSGTAYFITYDANDQFGVGAVPVDVCGVAGSQFEASLSVGDLLTFTNAGPDTGSIDTHNITQDTAP
ncbi:MAG: hypothetical protein H0W95_10680 [Nocardioidaceae bacterium]|nr:hypothetical protein [Nocardioidaceae bacterium]